MIVWLTGHSGSGKTTLAQLLVAREWINLDGDDMRNSISEEDFSKEGRRKHNLRVARLAKVLSRQQHDIVVSVIAPMREVRKEIDKICNPIWVYLKKRVLDRKDHFYEESNHYLTIDMNRLSIEEAYNRLIDFLGENSEGF